MINNVAAYMSPGTTDVPAASNPQRSGFDAAFQAAQKAEAARAAHEQTMAEIAEKGFTAWVADVRMEKLKEELRKKIMAEMGLDEDSMALLDDKIQAILEQKIQEELETRLAALEKEQESNGSGLFQAAAEPGKKDQDGKKCPVIPALVHPGAESLS